MFKSVHIQGYKSIRSQTVALGRMNVLIGGNGAGKSNFLSVFQLAKAVGEEALDEWVEEHGGANRILHLGRKNTQEIRLEFELSGESSTEVNFAFAEKADRLKLVSAEGYKEHKECCRNLRVYHFVDTGKTSPIKQNSPEDIILCDNAGEETAFRHLEGMDLSAWQNDYSLGELWEKNVFGGLREGCGQPVGLVGHSH